uniref:Uncharacterized protein n=1 Tax=Romanomermis culicivorax TaxID=13658 RepID=A0A915JJR6_ROMCU
MFYASLAITASSTLTNFFFAKVDCLAGLLILPCSLWSFYQTMQIGLAYRRLKSFQIDGVPESENERSTPINRIAND